MILTYKYRIKDSASKRELSRLAGNVNFVWNYVNSLSKRDFLAWKRSERKKKLSAIDIKYLLIGSYKQVNLPAQSIQAVAECYVSNRDTFKKPYLSWRSRKRSLGWIPFKHQDFKIKEDKVFLLKKQFKIYKDRSLPADAAIKCGSFNCDNLGRWFVSITFETAEAKKHVNAISAVGIDLGIKEVMTLSNEDKINRVNATNTYQDRLATAQRAKKKRQIKKILNKIKNTRKDFYHKATTKIAKQFETIYIGDVKSQDIIDKDINTNLTKGVYDASWYMIKNLLEYKAKKLGGFFYEVKENYTTQTCSYCFKKTGPKSIDGLAVRVWDCEYCYAKHDRDINSARNILRIGHDTPFTGDLRSNNRIGK